MPRATTKKEKNLNQTKPLQKPTKPPQSNEPKKHSLFHLAAHTSTAPPLCNLFSPLLSTNSSFDPHSTSLCSMNCHGHLGIFYTSEHVPWD